MNDIPMVIDDDGTLREPSFHDGYLCGFSLHENSSGKIFLRDIDNHNYCLEMSGIRNIKVSEFRENNIILSVGISEGATCGLDLLNELFDYGNKENASRYAQRMMQEIDEKKLKILDMSSSYGGTAIVLCESFKLIQVL